MKYFAGLDVSLEETAICVVDAGEQIVKEARAASEPQALARALREIDLLLERIGHEACSLTAWLHDGLCAEVTSRDVTLGPAIALLLLGSPAGDLSEPPSTSPKMRSIGTLGPEIFVRSSLQLG